MIISVADLLLCQTSAMEACAIRSPNGRKQGSRSTLGLNSTCKRNGERRKPVARHALCGKSWLSRFNGPA
jgi:hypothetical protein